MDRQLVEILVSEQLVVVGIEMEVEWLIGKVAAKSHQKQRMPSSLAVVDLAVVERYLALVLLRNFAEWWMRLVLVQEYLRLVSEVHTIWKQFTDLCLHRTQVKYRHPHQSRCRPWRGRANHPRALLAVMPLPLPVPLRSYRHSSPNLPRNR
jgi:hypothetical protein